MKRVRASARRSWQDRGGGRFWIDHRTPDDADLSALASARHLILWNVRFPAGSLGRLSQLEIFDYRGGSASSLSHLSGTHGLRALVVNQVRGLADLSLISGLSQLEYLSLYGLPQVDQLPSFDGLSRLTRVELGQMRKLADLSPLLRAPALEELLFVKRLAVHAADVRPLREHARLQSFDWFWEDVPASQAVPVLEVLTLPKARTVVAEDWLAQRDSEARESDRSR